MPSTVLHAVCYQPDIALNLGAMMRLCACTDVHLHVIDPCGFPFSPEKFKRSAMDYAEHVAFTRHITADAFFTFAEDEGLRTVLLTTKTDHTIYNTAFREGDALIFGRESAGVPEDIAARCALRVTIPMNAGARSMNIVTSAAMAVGEARRQVMFAQPLPDMA